MFRLSRGRAATVVALLWMSSWSLPADAGSIAGNAVPEGPAALWQQEAQLRASDGTGDDRLGFSVAFAGDTAVIGALGDDVADNDDQGAVYVFVRSGGVWTEQAKLTASDGAESDHFGWSVGISGDTVVVGAPDATVDGNFSQGAAYVFTRDGGAWTEQAKLTASDGAGSDDFGRAVGVSGDTALVGAYFHEVNDNFRQGAAYVFTRNAGAWSEQAILTASDGEANTRFGSAVAVDGDTALVTAQTANVGDNSLQGAAYVFTRGAGAWSEQGKLTASDGAAFDQLGNAATVAGDTAVIGAAFAGVDGNFQQGAAYVFTRSAGVWSEQSKLTAADGAGSDVFGDAVAIDGDAALIGTPGQNAAYLFTRSDGVWGEEVKLLPGGGAPGSFGNGVALSGMTSVVGAPGTRFVTEASQGAAYAFFDVPPDFGTLQGSVQSLGYCDDAVIPLAGATLTITGAQGTYTPVTDGAATYQVFLADDESPLDITVTAPGHVPVTTEGVVLGAGETVTVDFDLPFDAPCPSVDPAGVAVELLPDEVVTETVTLGNVGTADFDWEVVTDAPAAQGLRLPTDTTTPVTVSQPRPLTGDGEWGASDGEGRLRVDPATELSGGPLTLTHSESLDVVAGTTMICRAGDGSTPEQSFLRTFTLADFGIDDDFGITEVAFGIESLSTPATIDVNLYTLEGELVFDNLTLIGSTSVSLSAQQLTFVEVPVSATAPAGSTLVVEIRAPDLFLIGGFFPGSNSAGETAHSYVSAVACGNPDPVTFSSIGFPDVHLVMAVSGGSADCGAPWLSVVPGSGTVAPDGSQQVDVTLDSTGLFPVPGEYHSRICLGTNDTQRPEIFVPVDLSVTIPPDFATLEGIVEGLGHCGATPVTVGGASVVVTSQVDSYTLSPDEAGFYRLGLDPAEGPVDIAVSAPGHTPQTVSGVTLTAGETALHDFSLVLEQPCATVTPQEHTSELPPDSGEVVELTLGNVDGGAALNWSIATAEPPAAAEHGAARSGDAPARRVAADRAMPGGGTSEGDVDLASALGEAMSGLRPGNAAGGGIDCDAEPGLIIHDDGTIENAYSGSVATGVVDVRFVDRFTPSFHPASLRAVCLAFATVEDGPDSLDFEIVVYDDDGPDGGPGTELGSLPATATGIPEFPVDAPVWASFDISSLDITIATGSVYVGARWTPSDPNVWLAADESPENPVGFAEGFWWNDNDGVWAPTENEFTDYRSMFVRAAVAGEVDCDNPTTVPWLSADPASGSIDASQSGIVEVSLDTSGLAPGTYQAGLCVTTNDPAHPLIAVPVSLTVVDGGAPSIDGDPDSLSSTLGQGEMEIQPLTLANLGDATLDWEVTEEIDALERLDALELEGGEGLLRAALVDPAGAFAYLGMQTSPGRVVKVDLETFERVDALTLEAGEEFAIAGVIDPAGQFAYFGTHTSPGRVVRVDLETFEHAGSITLAGGEDFLVTGTIDAAGAFAYFSTNTEPGRVIKIDLATFERAGGVTLAEDVPLSAAIDPAGAFAYFGTFTPTGQVVKVDLANMQPAGTLTLEDGESFVGTAVMGPAGDFVYFGTGSAPGRVVKIDLETFERAGAITLEDGENNLNSALIDPTGSHAYFGTQTSPGRVVKLELGAFERVEAITLEDGENSLTTAGIDPTGEHAYFGTFTNPGRVVKVRLRAAVGAFGPLGCMLPDWLSVDPTSGSVPGGDDQVVDVTFDATGLELGNHTAGLCLASNDPVSPLLTIPVGLTVVGDAPEQIKITAADGMNGDLFGRSIDIDGDTAVISADNADVDGVGNQGAAYIFVRDGETWVEQAKLIASDGAQFDQFGISVAVSGDTALIGTAADAAYVFTRDGETWTERAKLLASDAGVDDLFGIDVALEGDTAVIGARQADVDGNSNQGAAYVFVGSGDSWSEQAKLTASDGVAFDVFGDALAIHGDTVIVGAEFADPDGNDGRGAAWVFVRDGESWSEQGKLVAGDGVANDHFGNAVTVFGDTAVVGAHQATIDGTTFQGAAYVFTRDGGGTWSEQAKLVADDGAQGDFLGESVAAGDGVALAGALFADDAQGTAYVFTQDGASWSQELELTADDGAPADQFGKSVTLDGTTAAVGAWTATVDGNANQGTAYMFELAGIGPAVIPVDDGVVEVAADGQCSLIEAFENAVDGGATHADCVPGSPAGSTVVLAEGSLYTLTEIHNEDAGPTGLPSITGQVAVEGHGAVIERSDAAPLFRLLHVAAGGTLTLEELTLRGGALGNPAFAGAGVRNEGTLTVTLCTLTGNGGGGPGGAISNGDGAALTVDRSALQGNSGGGPGSGLHNAAGGNATVTHSTLSANGCGGGGCGIHNEGTLEVVDSTLSANSGPFANGINNLGTLTLDHTTLSNHTCGAGGCSLTNGGSVTMRNSMIAAPMSTGDCSGPPPTFEGVNLIQDGSCGCTGASCISGDPMLGELTDNGGPTQTHALPDGSIAIDKGGDDVCLGDDQRGVARPLDGVGDGSAEDLDGGCDIGAYEAPPASVPALVFDPASLAFGDVVVGTPSTPLTATLSNTGDADATGLVFSTPGNGFEADTTDCGFFLAPGDSCDVVVTFTPPAVGSASAELQADALEGATALLALAGNGVEPPAPELGFTPSSLDFGDVDVGTTSEPQGITLVNTGDGDATGLTFGPLGGGFEADTTACGTTLAAGASCVINVTFSPADPGEATATLQVGSGEGASASAGLSGNGVGGEGFTPVDLAVDPPGLAPEANGLFEPGESVDVAPAWRNDGELAASLGGTASNFTGPEGAAYSIDLADADYGLIEPGDTASCLDTELCYRLGLDDPAARPAAHWDASFDETLDDTDGTTQTWTLHVGASFDDVPTANPFYPAIETLLHSGITGGCTAGAEAAGVPAGRGPDLQAGTDGRDGARPLQGAAAYCPGGANSRAQMPVFVLRALMGSDYTPPACDEGADPFGDVPFDSPFCPWIQDLADRGIVSGCGDGDYCPGNPVSRAQMSIFLLKTLEGADYEPPACSNQFTDVPCPSLFADWIEELAAREITGGCSETEYCPADAVSRAQMAVFVTRTFGLTLYGP